MADWREAILTKLDGYCGFTADVRPTGIFVRCKNPDSFEPSIIAAGDGFQVRFAGWHEHFMEETDALNCFAFGLSNECRLKVEKRGQMECSWTVQSLVNGSWEDDATTGLLLVPFWRTARVRYLQNQLEKKQGNGF